MLSKTMCDGALEVLEDGSIYKIKNGNKQIANIIKAGDKKQYCMLSYMNKGKQIHKYVHRLVAEAFIPNPLELSQVNHKDGNTLNNSVNNLEWSSSSENVKTSFYKNVLIKSNPCLRCGEPTLTKDKICTSCKNEIIKETNKENRLAEIKDLMGSINMTYLSENQRKYVNRRKEGLNYTEIAKLYGVSRQAVEQSIKTALLKGDKPNTEDRLRVQKINSLKSKIQKKKSKIDDILIEIQSLENQLEQITI